MDSFSDNMLSRLLPEARAYNVPDPLRPGLLLEVLPSGLKRWRLRREIDGRRRQATLGAWPGLIVAQARKLAGRLGPSEAPATFGDLASLWLSAMGSSAPRLSVDVLERAILPALGPLELGKISATDILVKVIRPLVDALDLEGASRARGVCARLFRLGEAAGAVSGNPASLLPEKIHPDAARRLSPVIDPAQASFEAAHERPFHAHSPGGHAIEARPHHYAVKRNPLLAGLSYDPSHPGGLGYERR